MGTWFSSLTFICGVFFHCKFHSSLWPSSRVLFSTVLQRCCRQKLPLAETQASCPYWLLSILRCACSSAPLGDTRTPSSDPRALPAPPSTHTSLRPCSHDFLSHLCLVLTARTMWSELHLPELNLENAHDLLV